MRILFLCHRFPFPPTFGSKVRAFHAIRHLAQRHEVTVLSLARNAQEESVAGGIGEHCQAYEAVRVHNLVQAAKIAACLPTRVSASEAFFHSAKLQRVVDRHLASGRYDFIFAHCSAVGRYVEQVELPKLMDLCDVDSQKWSDYAAFKPAPLSWGYQWESWRVAALERRLARRFDRTTVATPGEAETLRQLGVEEGVDWFPNGVDTGYFQPGTQPWDPEVISFVGRMDYFPNEQAMVDFCSDVWPSLRRARPTLKLKIVGAHPTTRVRQLERFEGVSVTGSVPDVRPHVQGSALTVVPLKIARGTQNKILEAMAMRVPVIASSTAAKGVDAAPGQHLLVADEPLQLCETILRVLDDRAERERLAEAGRERTLSHNAWSSAMTRLDGIVERCLTRGPAAHAHAAPLREAG